MTAWDDGISWHTNVVEEPLEPTLTTAFVRDDFLRLPSVTSAEDAYLSHLIRVTTRQGERVTRRAWMPQTRELVLSRFPCWEIEIPWPPLIEIVSVAYVDTDGSPQTLDASDYQVSAPVGPTCRKGIIAPARNTVWPLVDPQALDAVTVTYRCGYVDGGSPEAADVPKDLLQGQLLLIGEMYKQRSESVIGLGLSINPALVRARDIFREYRVP